MNALIQKCMNRKTLYFQIVTGLILLGDTLRADIPMLTDAQNIQWIRMEDMRWLVTLTAQQVEEVRSAHRSGQGMVVEPALHNVILHRLEELTPVIEEGVSAPKTAARQFGEICAQVLKLGGDPIERLRQALTTELPGDEFIPISDKIDYCRPVRHMITSLIVFHEVRAVRAGEKKEPDLTGLVLSAFETELVTSSALGASAAITQFVDELARAGVIGTRETTLLQVLRTYPTEQYAPLVLDRLEAKGGEANYGSQSLVRSLRWHGKELRPREVARLRSVIEAIRRGPSGPSMQAVLSAMESELE